MAQSQSNGRTERSFKAGEDFSSLQYWAVRQSSTQNQVDLADESADDTSIAAIGVIQNAPKSGDSARVALFGGGGTTKVVAFAAISLGAEVAIEESDGRFSTAESADWIRGIALEAATAQNDIIEVALTVNYKKA